MEHNKRRGIILYDRALRLMESTNYCTDEIFRVLWNKGRHHYDLKEYKESEESFAIAESLMSQFDDDGYKSIFYLVKARLMIKLRHFKKAEHCLSLSSSLCTEFYARYGFRKAIEQAYKELYEEMSTEV